MNRFKRKMAEIAVRSVLAVADIPRRDVRFDLIKLTVITIPSSSIHLSISLKWLLCLDQDGRQAGGYRAD